ncbi:MAG TPA: DUF4112 domain-containing protein [Hyphomicrobiaceae bacterium]|nr:DUF4112 domain-containing protein [Hyphomicrobiaceae bacterium]
MRHVIPSDNAALTGEYARLFERLERSSFQLDVEYRIPYTRIYFGWDPIIGIVPIAGDLACAALSVRNIHWAYRLGANRRVLLKMAVNSTIDALLGAVPVVGTLFDVWFRAHVRNFELLVAAIEAQRQQHSEAGPP